MEEKLKYLENQIWLVELEILVEERTNEIQQLNLRHSRLLVIKEKMT